MAKIEGIAKVKVDGQEAGKQLEVLQSKAKDLRKAIISVQKADILDNKKLKNLKTQLKGVNSEMKQVKNTTFSYQKTLNNLSGASISELNRAYGKLNREVKKLDRNTTEYKTKAANLKGIRAELTKVRMDMVATGKSSKRMLSGIADGFNKYGGMILGIAGSLFGLVFSARKAVDAFNEFEAAESNLSALTGLTGDKLKYLSDAAKAMSTSITEDGVRITKSALDIEKAFATVGSQRPELLKNKEALKQVTEDALILAEASKMELAPSVTAVTSALNNFNLGAEESRRVINVFGAGSKAGAADVEKLTKVFDKAGTTANLMGLDIESLVGISEAVAPKFNDMSKAGNSLDKVLLKMKDGNIGYVNGIFDIQVALDQVREKTEAGTSVTSMFGVEHAKMVEVLLAEQEQITYYTDAVTDSNVAIEQAIINTSNNAAALEQARNRAQENAIVLGEKLAPALTFSTDAWSYMLKILVKIIENWDVFVKYLKISIVTIGTYVTLTKGASIVQNTWNKLVKVATILQNAFNKSMKASPWAIIVTLITGAVAALALFKKKNDDTANAIKDFNKELIKEKAKLKDVFEEIKNTTKGTEERKKAIEKANEVYGTYMPFLLTEKSTLSEITIAQNKATKALERNIALKIKQQEIEKAINIAVRQRAEATTVILDKATKSNKEALKSATDDLNKLVEKELEKGTKALSSQAKLDLSLYAQKYGISELSLSNLQFALINIRDAEKEKRRIIAELNAAFSGYSAEETPIPDTTNAEKDEDAELEEEKRKNEKLKKINQKAWEEKPKANQSVNELIRDLNLQLIEDVRQKAIEEANIWFEKEQKKIQISKASTALKAQAVEVLEKVHKQKLLSIEEKYNAETIKKFENVNSFLAQQQAQLETDRDAIIQRDIEKIQAKYDAKIKIIEEELLKDGELNEAFILQKAELEKLRDEEIKKFKLKKEQEFAKQIIATREQYGLVSQEEHFWEELALLDEHLANELLSEEEYQKIKKDIQKKYSDKAEAEEDNVYKKRLKKNIKHTNDLRAVLSALSNFVSTEKEIELQNAGDNEEKKKEIMKRYADKEFAVKAAQIVANTALGIMQAIGQLGPIAGAIAAVLIGATGALQLSVANGERNRIKGLAEGGGIPVTREQDGKNFNAVYGGNKSGLFTKPTVLVAEEGPEYVIPYSGLQNPEIRSFVGAIESSRQAGSLHNFEYQKAITAGHIVKGYADGGYTANATTDTPEQNNDFATFAALLIIEMQKTRTVIEQKADILKAYISYDDIEEAQKLMNEVKSEVTI